MHAFVEDFQVWSMSKILACALHFMLATPF